MKEWNGRANLWQERLLGKRCGRLERRADAHGAIDGQKCKPTEHPDCCSNEVRRPSFLTKNVRFHDAPFSLSGLKFADETSVDPRLKLPTPAGMSGKATVLQQGFAIASVEQL